LNRDFEIVKDWRRLGIFPVFVGDRYFKPPVFFNAWQDRAPCAVLLDRRSQD
jgi:hypothetical protein